MTLMITLLMPLIDDDIMTDSNDAFDNDDNSVVKTDIGLAFYAGNIFCTTIS